MTTPHGQTQYQVRFDWGTEGADAIAHDVDVVIVVDVLTTTPDPSPVLEHVRGGSAEVVAASLRNRSAVAQWALEQQGDKGERFFIAVIAAGEPSASGATRFAVEDLLAAGAVIDALADAGIDYCSPEAAAAAAAFTGLRNATAHLIGASASGRELTAAGRRADIDHAIDIDADVTLAS
ncbi:MAG: 2-phosphosulfolactate phosphatase [Actinomycetota bacterium]|nr:2-phosphosulfolactate phosphatase [Actinomycetota bacterium]